MHFYSPTKGRLTIAQMVEDIAEFVHAGKKGDTYKLIIGTDSQPGGDNTCFVTAVIIHRVGKGARFYYHREYKNIKFSLQNRIFTEASLSLEVATRIISSLINLKLQLSVEIHLDVGESGPTRELVQQVVGMVTASGFAARVKPASYGASKVADRFTK
ncbi:MAG: uncharacterized protein PWQ31_431 [Eubacteriales bacterium]|nr:uncharacterized protein [Eubacteriales bacterium]